ncbi:MAG: HEAT repeat domain-containing protein [Planctomycetaceae bacterium]|nr:HEAT repeat domain-containing protein [Planctomycetaceae bacterium]
MMHHTQWSSRRIGAAGAVLIAASVLSCAAGGAAGQDYMTALNYLSAALADNGRTRSILPALRAVRDPALLPVFAALSRCGDRELRAFAVEALPECGGAEAGAALKERVWNDPSNEIRAGALVHLSSLKILTDQELLDVIAKVGDENVRSLAADMLTQGEGRAKAIPALRSLVKSKDPTIRTAAQLALLKLGIEDFKDDLFKAAADANTSDAVVSLLVRKIGQDKIAAGLELARQVAQSDRAAPVRVSAYAALAELSPRDVQTVRTALQGSDMTIFKIYLLKIVAKSPQAQQQLRILASNDNPSVAVLVRLELARLDGAAQTGAAAAAALKLGHPIVVDYVVECARKDMADRGPLAEAYVAPLLAYIRSLDAPGATLGADHIRGAMAATLLINLGTPAATDGLREIAAGRYGSGVRMVGAALMRTTNPECIGLARVLIASSYQEVVFDGALTLARFNQPQALPALRKIVDNPDPAQPGATAMAAWYVLKLSGKGPAAARALAEQIK